MEIKFRVWDNVDYMTHFSLNDLMKNKIVFTDECPVMQFTGLKDKNGKEIYEGDIVKCGYGKGEVVFNAGCFMVQWIDDKEANMEFLFSRKGTYRRKDDEAFEVIGNIHENPELLNRP